MALNQICQEAKRGYDKKDKIVQWNKERVFCKKEGEILLGNRGEQNQHELEARRRWYWCHPQRRW